MQNIRVEIQERHMDCRINFLLPVLVNVRLNSLYFEIICTVYVRLRNVVESLQIINGARNRKHMWYLIEARAIVYTEKLPWIERHLLHSNICETSVFST